MLQLLGRDLDRFANEHYLNLANEISERIEFYLLTTNYLLTRQNEAAIRGYNGYSQSTLASLLKPFLIKSNYGKDYSKAVNEFFQDQYRIDPGSITLNELNSNLGQLNNDGNLERILTAEPSDLKNTAESLQNNDLMKNLPCYDKILLSIFNYDKFSDKANNGYGAYTLADKLKVNTCLYCNRQYTITIAKGRNTVRPAFDHFYCKNDYPILALSFFNLIPACNICNSTFKGKIAFTLTEYLHPYIEGFGDDGYFWYSLRNVLRQSFDESQVILHLDSKQSSPNAQRIKNHIDLFHLQELYNEHKDLLLEIIQKAQDFNPNYISSLASWVKGATKEEIYRYYFGNYYQDKDLTKRVLSKFTRDIVMDTPGINKYFSK